MIDKFLARKEFASYEDFRENYCVHVPQNFNFAYDVVDAIAESDPDRLAILWCNEIGHCERFTFRQVMERSNQFAHVFADHGVGKGTPVMLILKRQPEFWFSLLALHRLGAVAVPATHLVTAKDILYRRKLADIHVVVVVNEESICTHVAGAEDPALPPLTRILVGGSRTGWISLDRESAEASCRFPRPTGDAATCNTDTSLLYFTSGTTGMPKMVLHDFTYPLGHIPTAAFWQNVAEGGLHLTLADSGWAKAVWGKIYGQWIGGCAVFVYDIERFQPGLLLKAMGEYGVTSFCAPPTVYRFLIKEDLRKFPMPALRYCTVAGEPLNPEVYERWLEGTGLKLREGYGQTEMTLAIGTFPWMEPKPGSMGKPAPGYDVALFDEWGQPCPDGKEGQIVLRTQSQRPIGLFRGYFRDPELTNEVWRDGVYYTGDMAYRDEDGYYWFVGRTDDVIKSSGYRIGPFEVESALMEHPAVMECAVIGVPDPLRGSVVKAVVVLVPGCHAGPSLAHELQEHVKRITAPYKYPRIIEFAEALPKTISGKIRRTQLRQDSQN